MFIYYVPILNYTDVYEKEMAMKTPMLMLNIN
jgi:hypothetical protein